MVSSHGGAATSITRANQISKRAHCHAKNDLFSMMLTTGQSNQRQKKQLTKADVFAPAHSYEMRITKHSAIDCHCLDYVRHAGAFDKERGQHVQKIRHIT